MSKSHLRQITFAAMLTAISIVLERFITITPPSNMLDFRITLSNVPLIVASIFISPLAGGLGGIVSDIIGCFISGYAPFPLLTVAPFITGFLPGVITRYTAINSTKASFFKKAVIIVLSVFVTHLLSSVLVTTYGLSVMRGMGFVPMLITRLPSMAAGFVIDAVLVTVLYQPLHTVITKK